MNIVRRVARWVLGFFMGLAVSLWIFLATANVTIGNRDVVKGWLAQSDVYSSALPALLRVAPTTDADSSLISPDILQKALVKTFDAGYLQQKTNTVINATYDWVEGKTKALTFSIPVQEQTAVFGANLADLITPKLQALPTCTSKIGNTDLNHVTCIPSGTTAAEYAKQLTKTSDDKNFLREPITEQTFASGAPKLTWLPQAYGTFKAALIALPVAALVMAGLYVLAAQDKLRGLGHIGQQLTFSAGVTLVGGLVLWYASTSVDLSAAIDAGDDQQRAAVVAVVNPLARAFLPSISQALSLYSGIVVAIGGSLWLGSFLWRRQLANKHHGPVIPPAHDKEAQLPPPKIPAAK